MLQWTGAISVTNKFRIIVGTTLLGLLLVAGLGLSSLRDSLDNSRALQTRSIVESAVSVTRSYYDAARAGTITEDEARQRAREALRSMHYGNGEYMWINDMNGVMLMHGAKASMENKDMLGLKDTNGKQFFVEMIAVVKASGAGTVRYMWPKAGQEVPVNKVSYVIGFQPWGWIIGTGVYTDDIDREFYSKATSVSIIASVVLIVVVGISIMFASGLTRPLAEISGVMGRLAEGDSDITINHRERRDEVGIMARALESLRKEADQAFNLRQMVDVQPARVMMCDPHSLKITYINQAARDLIRKMAHPVSARADSLVGTSVASLHKNPEMVEKLLADPRNLPYQGKFTMGGVTIENYVTAIYDRKGNYIGPMLNWEDVTKYMQMADEFQQKVHAVSQSVGSGAQQMEDLAGSMLSRAKDTSARTAAVASAAELATSNVQTVAAAAEELSASIAEIRRQAGDATSIAREAVEEARRTDDTMRGLTRAADQIGEVVNLITTIAEQTNLLALNATIEAARAGDAGKGFAVVANEVKNLANQTARATEDIGNKIQEVQNVSAQAVQAIGMISSTIGRIDEIAAEISSAVIEQGSATEEISRNVDMAARGTLDVTSNISTVAQVASETGDEAASVLSAASELSDQSEQLGREVAAFLEKMKA